MSLVEGRTLGQQKPVLTLTELPRAQMAMWVRALMQTQMGAKVQWMARKLPLVQMRQ